MSFTDKINLLTMIGVWAGALSTTLVAIIALWPALMRKKLNVFAENEIYMDNEGEITPYFKLSITNCRNKVVYLSRIIITVNSLPFYFIDGDSHQGKFPQLIKYGEEITYKFFPEMIASALDSRCRQDIDKKVEIYIEVLAYETLTNKPFKYRLPQKEVQGLYRYALCEKVWMEKYNIKN
ncbi:MAG: hypothetical protein K0Q57_433 [Gammaproteobacteria bacterium]|jgi:hypothetical protein|nr:hypothetical protein [Gammaproteobacteria bacterium]